MSKDGDMEQLGEIMKRMAEKVTGEVPEELVENMRYLKNQWLNSLRYQVRQALGENCLTWNPSLCRDLVSVEEMGEATGGSILLCGPVGTGKTTSAVHILLTLADRYASALQRGGSDLPDPDGYVVVLSAPYLFRKLSQMFGNAGEQADELMERCQRARILFVDDIGSEGGTEEACAAFDEIMNQRYGNKRNRTTIVTSNLMPDEWQGYRNGRLARAADRWREDRRCIVLKGESMRQDNREAAWPEEFK